MTTAIIGGIAIEYQCYGDDDGKPLLLIQGMGTQMVMWPGSMIEGLVNQGFRVIAFDSRDCGLSQKFDDWGPADLGAAFAQIKQGQTVTAPYDLDDMAVDTAGLIDLLGYQRMHVAGLSNGGAIAQILAINFPEKVQSLTLIMSTSARRGLPKPSPEATLWLAQPRNPQGTLQGAIEDALDTARVIGSPAFPATQEALSAAAQAQFERNYCPDGFGRHFLASLSSADRRVAKLSSIAAPTLIVQGAEDPLVPAACAKDLHSTISDSRLLMIEGMGHDLPVECLPQIVDAIAALASNS